MWPCLSLHGEASQDLPAAILCGKLVAEKSAFILGASGSSMHICGIQPKRYASYIDENDSHLGGQRQTSIERYYNGPNLRHPRTASVVVLQRSEERVVVLKATEHFVHNYGHQSVLLLKVT